MEALATGAVRLSEWSDAVCRCHQNPRTVTRESVSRNGTSKGCRLPRLMPRPLMTSAIRRGPSSPDRAAAGRSPALLPLPGPPTRARTAEESPRICTTVLDPARDLKEPRWILRTVVRPELGSGGITHGKQEGKLRHREAAGTGRLRPAQTRGRARQRRPADPGKGDRTR